MFDMVAAGKWTRAAAGLPWFKEGIPAMKARVKVGKADAQRLTASTGALQTAISHGDRHTAMVAANDITYVVARLSKSFTSRVPVAVAELDYYGRELQIWSEAKDVRRLEAGANDLQRTWAGLRPEVESHGGLAQARAFEGLVQKLQRAKTVSEYRALVSPILDRVDDLERVFTA